MKILSITIIMLLSGVGVSAQVFIDQGNTHAVHSGALLEVTSGASGKLGIILPRVSSDLKTEGTLYYNATTKTIKYGDGTATAKDLFGNRTDNGFVAGAVSYVPNTAESGGGVVIGTDDTTVNGVLELNGIGGLLLPKIASPQDIVVNPEAGMICYDTDTSMLAMYNGSVWTFWKS